jgi:hypothetical protein
MRTHHFLAFIRFTMLAGALYDAALAIPVMVAPGSLARILGLPMPDTEIHLRFLGVFLLILSLYYLAPVLYPGRYLGNVAIAALGRAMGAAFLIFAVLQYDQPRPYLLLGMVDLVFGMVHYISLLPFSGFAVWRIAGMDLSYRSGCKRS